MKTNLMHRQEEEQSHLVEDYGKLGIKRCLYVFQGVRRTSNLQAPIMQLEGHEGEIFTTEFHPEGEMLLSSGFDRQLCKIPL